MTWFKLFNLFYTYIVGSRYIYAHTRTYAHVHSHTHTYCCGLHKS